MTTSLFLTSTMRWQIETKEAIADQVSKLAVLAIVKAGEHLSSGVPYTESTPSV